MSKSLAPLRGEGLTYSGSLTEYHGQQAREVTDCTCGPCSTLEEWDPARRLMVHLASGWTLAHVRSSSLQRPAEAAVTTLAPSEEFPGFWCATTRHPNGETDQQDGLPDFEAALKVSHWFLMEPGQYALADSDERW